VTTDQILFGVGLILVLAVGSQVLASRLRIPAHPSPRDKLSPANSRSGDTLVLLGPGQAGKA